MSIVKLVVAIVLAGTVELIAAFVLRFPSVL